MNCNTHKIDRQRQVQAMTEALHLVLPAALLAGDDIFCVTHKQTEMYLHAVAEILNGYSEDKRGATLLREEANTRGIQICIKDDFFNMPAPKRYERAPATWATITLPDGKKRTICSRCEYARAVKEAYCGHCGADTRNSEQEISIVPEWVALKDNNPPQNVLLRICATREDGRKRLAKAEYENGVWKVSEPLEPEYKITHWAFIERNRRECSE